MYLLSRGILAFLIACIGFTFLLCTPQITGVGTGSETVIGKIVHEDGTPASGTVVTLYPVNFDPASDPEMLHLCLDTTDSNGYYTITINSSKVDVYTLQASNLKQQTRTIVSDIDISASGDSTLIDAARLYKTGSIQVKFSDIPATRTGYVFIPGTNYYSYVKDGSAIIDSVPAQTILQVFFKESDLQDEPRSLAENIDVQPEITTIVASSGPLYSRKIFLNTTSTGADVAGNVTDFPVLVRLHSGNFDFSQAKADGGDLLFTKENGQTIPHEIERWNSSRHEAEIWVKVDTVYGNDSTQFISLHWVDPEATSSSSGSAVFDLSAGYKGVWHLGDNGETVLDATGNNNTGSRNGDKAPVKGNIGLAQSFDGTGDYTDMGDVCNLDTSSLTVCAWIKKIGEDKIQTIVAKSVGNLPNETYGWLFQLDGDGALSIFMASDSGVWGDPGSFVLTGNTWVTDSSWHHVAAVVDRSDRDNCRVYLDGADISALPTGGDIRSVGTVLNTAPLRFGTDSNGHCQWEGSLDEISILYRVKSPGFIKLSYMNQKSNDKLTVFK